MFPHFHGKAKSKLFRESDGKRFSYYLWYFSFSFSSRMLTVFAPECVLLPKESSSKCFLPIQCNKKRFQLYNGEWCWNSKFIFEKATILKILGWYRVRVVVLTCGGLRGRCKWEICKYILMYKEDKPADKRL